MKTIKLLTTSVLAILIILVCLEIGCYLAVKAFHLEKEKALTVEAIAYYPKWWRYSSVLGLTAKPDFPFVRDGSGAYLGTDRYGFCHNGDPGRKLVPKKKGVRRIFVLGGSTIWGSRLSANEDTIPAQMEKMLNAHHGGRFFKTEVINAGMRGWLSYQEFCYLTKDLLYYEPDMVVVLDGINDFYYSRQEKGLPPNLSAPLAEMELMFNMREKNMVDGLIYHVKGGVRSVLSPLARKCRTIYGFIRRKSHLLYMMGKIMRTIEPLSRVNKHVAIEALKSTAVSPGEPISYRYYIQNLKNIIGVCKMNGIDCVVLFQPTLASGHKKYLTKEEKKLLNEIEASFQIPDVKSRLSGYYKKVAVEFEKLKSLYQSEQVFIEDLSNIFSGVRQNVYSDAIHYNAEGAKILAGRMSRIIEENFAKRE